MGPRARRRLAIGGSLGLGVIGAVVAVLLLTRSSTPSGHVARSSTSSGHAATAQFKVSERDTYKLVAGMSGKQVRHVLGPPTSKRGRCWLYRATPDSRLAAQGVVETDVNVCFFGGRFSDRTVRDYVRQHGRLVALNETYKATR